MKIKKSVGMFQIAERNFTAPSHVIAVFDIFQVKRVGKIGNDIFVCIFSSFDFKDTKLHEIKVLPIQKCLEMGNILIGTHVVINMGLLVHDIGVFIRKEPF